MIKPIGNLRGAVVVWLVSYVFFLFTLADNFSASHDSIHYLLNIASGDHLFHQHHLLYNYYAHTWLSLFKNIFPSVADHYHIESFTAVWGSGNLAVCYLFLRNRFNVSKIIAAIGVTLIGFSYGTWFYSVNIEVYAPPVFFILCCLYILTKKQPVRSDAWKVAILHSIAILFHQVNLLLSVVVIYWLWMNRKKFNAMSAFLQYAVLGIILAGGVYIFCGVFYEQKQSIGELVQWLMGYTSGEYSFWQPLSSKTPLNAAAGFGRAFVGGHFIFQYPYLQDAVSNSFSSHGLRDEIFLSGNITRGTAYLLGALSVVFVLMIVAMSFRFAAKYRGMALHHHVIRPLLVCIAVYSFFFLFWMPEILEFWILQMILVWLLLVGMLPLYRLPLRMPVNAGLIILSMFLFCINYFGSIRLLQDRKNDWYYAEVQKLDRKLTPNDIVVVEGEWILKDYVRYFSKAKVIATDEPGFNREDAGRSISNAVAAGNKVYRYRTRADGRGISWVPIRSF